MGNIDREALVKDKRVVEEINRHLWIESEKAGRDIGFEAAKEDWLNRFAEERLKFNALKKNKAPSNNKKRGAKSYFK